MRTEKERCQKELIVEKYFGLLPDEASEKNPILTDFGNLVNLLYMFEQSGEPIIVKGNLQECKDELIEYTRCDGCGATNPSKRCIGCRHVFAIKESHIAARSQCKDLAARNFGFSDWDDMDSKERHDNDTCVTVGEAVDIINCAMNLYAAQQGEWIDVKEKHRLSDEGYIELMELFGITRQGTDHWFFDQVIRLLKTCDGQQPKNEWISATERLPEGVTSFKTMSDFVAVYCGKGGADYCGTGRYCHDRKRWYAESFKSLDCSEWVSHWKPFTPPSK